MHVAGTEVYAPVLGQDTPMPGHRQGQLGTGSHAPPSAAVATEEWGSSSLDDEMFDDDGCFLLYDELGNPLADQVLAQQGRAEERSPVQAADSFGFAQASSAVGTPSLSAVNELTNTQAGASNGQTAAAWAGRDASESAADADIQNLVQSLNVFHIPETVLDADDPVADHIQAGCEA